MLSVVVSSNGAGNFDMYTSSCDHRVRSSPPLFFFLVVTVLIKLSLTLTGLERGGEQVGNWKLAAFTSGELHREGYGPGNRTELYHSADSLTCMNTTKCHTNPSPWNMAS